MEVRKCSELEMKSALKVGARVCGPQRERTTRAGIEKERLGSGPTKKLGNANIRETRISRH
ncbi:MAG: hypothetical protein LBF22_07710 [Deltaproteobacteria bacterium]|jgi:hypothetical protein|nr:hypothetical protein [Deltaproteobacteria bacterium]